MKPTKPNQIDVTFAQVRFEAKELGETIRNNPKFKTLRHIVPVVRGGMVPALLLSHYLGLPISGYIRASSYTESNSRDMLTIDDYAIPKGALGFGNALVVDDIIDSGATVAQIAKMFPLVSIVCLMQKPKGMEVAGHHLLVEPTAIYNNSHWVSFPWEI